MQRYLFVLIIFCATSVGVQAQTLQGRITDADTGELLSGATVFAPGIQVGSAAEADGTYSLEFGKPGTYRVIYSFIGYQAETQTVAIGDGVQTLDVALRPTAIEAPPVTITAKAQASDILSTPQAVVVLEGRDLAENRGATAFDALEHASGVRLLRTGVGVAKPVVRGLSSQRVLVIQNGIRQEGQQWGDEHGPELDAFDIDRIEVVKGPASLLYGSDALGGVIQAASRDPFTYTERLTGMAALQGMSNSMLGAAHLQLGGRAGAYGYEVTGTAKRGGSYDTPDGPVPNTGQEELNGAVRVGRTFKDATVLAEYQHTGAQIGLFEPDEADSELPADRFVIGMPYQRVAHDRARVQAEVPFSGNRLELTTSWQQNRRKEFGHHDEHEHDEPLDAATDIPDETLSAVDEHEGEPALFLRLTTLTANARLHHRPVGRLFGTVGLSGFQQNNETLAEETLIPAARTFNGGAFLYEEIILPRLTLSGGLRYDVRQLNVRENADLQVTEQTRRYGALSGAVGFAWQPHSGLSLAMNAGRAWRAPALIELFAQGVHEGTVRYELGDPTLEPERSLGLDATVRWLNPHIYVEVNGFVNRINDFIYTRSTGQTDPESGYQIFAYDQATAQLWGGEITADLHPHPIDWVHLRLSGDVTLTENLDTGDPLPFSPAPRIRAVAELERERFGPVHDVSLELGPTFTFEQNRVAPLEEPTDGYVLWEAGVSGAWHLPNMMITSILAVDNVFNAAYTSHLSRFRPYGILNPGRNIRLELQFRLP